LNQTQIERLLIEYPELPYRIKELTDKLLLTLALKNNTQDTLRAYKYSHEGKSKIIANPVLEAVQKSLDIHEESIKYYQEHIKDYTKRQLAMEKALENLLPVERRIIDLRYWKRYEWEGVGRAVHYNPNYCRELRNGILIKIWQNYDYII